MLSLSATWVPISCSRSITASCWVASTSSNVTPTIAPTDVGTGGAENHVATFVQVIPQIVPLVLTVLPIARLTMVSGSASRAVRQVV